MKDKQFREMFEAMTEEYKHLPVYWGISLWLARN